MNQDIQKGVGREGGSAAFFRLEGTVVRQPLVSIPGYLSMNAQGFGERILRTGNAALAPLLGLAMRDQRTMAKRISYLSLRGMSEDRAFVLCREYEEEFLRPRVMPRGLDLLTEAKKRGQRVVMISEYLDWVVHPLVESWGSKLVDQVFCNHLEVRAGVVTGKLKDPVVGGFETGKLIRRYFEENKIDSSSSYAYGSKETDVFMLSSVGFPFAVNADSYLAEAASGAEWPRIDFAREKPSKF